MRDTSFTRDRVPSESCSFRSDVGGRHDHGLHAARTSPMKALFSSLLVRRVPGVEHRPADA